jgi:hypothetical protein
MPLALYLLVTRAFNAEIVVVLQQLVHRQHIERIA